MEKPRGEMPSDVPMKILNVAYPFAPVHEDTAGGAEQVVRMLDRALCRAGHASFVIASAGSEVDGNLLATQTYRTAIIDAIQRWNPDLVHLHGLDFMEYLPPEGVPVLATLHLPPTWYPDSAFAIERPQTWLHCVSRSQQNACPVASNLLPFIPNGVSESLWRDHVRKRDFALALGRICPEKGFHLAFEAAALAGIPCFLAGQVYGYSEHEHYFKQQILPRCDGRNRFIGTARLRRKRRLLAAARCLLVPSLAPETSSLVAMEAAMCGTPVIAFRAGALPEIVEDGVTGFLVNDVTGMADAINNCYRIDPRACREIARQRFSEQSTIAGYLGVYERLIRH